MGGFYKGVRAKNVFDPHAAEPFRISRSKIDDFLNCPKCFYLDRRLGVGRPPSFPFNLNNAVDTLLKKEFDIHRAAHTAHPLMASYGIDAVPFEDARMDEWRDALRRGVRYLHEPTNLLVTGGVDDVWVNPEGELIIADYKATSKETPVNLDADWQIGYKRQMEVYQWLFRKNGFKVQNTGYFVYCNGTTDRKAFDGKLEFDVVLLPYEGNDRWVEPALHRMRECLMNDTIPASGEQCDFCSYRRAASAAEEKGGRGKV